MQLQRTTAFYVKRGRTFYVRLEVEIDDKRHQLIGPWKPMEEAARLAFWDTCMKQYKRIDCGYEVKNRVAKTPAFAHTTETLVGDDWRG